MRVAGRSAFQVLLIGLGLALLCFAVWGMVQSYPRFDAERVEPARLTLPVPATATP